VKIDKLEVTITANFQGFYDSIATMRDLLNDQLKHLEDNCNCVGKVVEAPSVHWQEQVEYAIAEIEFGSFGEAEGRLKRLAKEKFTAEMLGMN